MLESLGLTLLREILSALVSEGYAALQDYLSLLRRDSLNQDVGRLQSEQRQADKAKEVSDAIDAVPEVTEDDVLKRLKDHTA